MYTEGWPNLREMPGGGTRRTDLESAPEDSGWVDVGDNERVEEAKAQLLWVLGVNPYLTVLGAEITVLGAENRVWTLVTFRSVETEMEETFGVCPGQWKGPGRSTWKAPPLARSVCRVARPSQPGTAGTARAQPSCAGSVRPVFLRFTLRLRLVGSNFSPSYSWFFWENIVILSFHVCLLFIP